MLQHLLKRVFLKLNLVDPRCTFEVREEISDCDTWADLRENKIKTIKEKLEKGEIGIEDEIVEYSGQTLLHQSIVINRFEVFLLCLLHRADVNKQTDEGMTPLHLAASLGREKMVEELLRSGADASAKDGVGMTALERAKMYSFERVQQILRGGRGV